MESTLNISAWGMFVFNFQQSLHNFPTKLYTKYNIAYYLRTESYKLTVKSSTTILYLYPQHEYKTSKHHTYDVLRARGVFLLSPYLFFHTFDYSQPHETILRHFNRKTALTTYCVALSCTHMIFVNLRFPHNSFTAYFKL